jgi:hypothetical protein
VFMSTYFMDDVNHNRKLWIYWAHLKVQLSLTINSVQGVQDNLIKTQ